MEPAVPPVSQHCVENDYGCGFNLCSGQSHDWWFSHCHSCLTAVLLHSLSLRSYFSNTMYLKYDFFFKLSKSFQKVPNKFFSCLEIANWTNAPTCESPKKSSPRPNKLQPKNNMCCFPALQTIILVINSPRTEAAHGFISALPFMTWSIVKQCLCVPWSGARTCMWHPRFTFLWVDPGS